MTDTPTPQPCADERAKRASAICTRDNPWDGDRSIRVIHAGAHEVGEQRDGYPGGDIVTMACPNCGHTWEMELAQ